MDHSAHPLANASEQYQRVPAGTAAWRSAEPGGLHPPGGLCTRDCTAGPLCGVVVAKDGKAGGAAGGRGRKPASGLGTERRFELGDDGKKAGRDGFEVVAAVADVGEDCTDIEENGALRI